MQVGETDWEEAMRRDDFTRAWQISDLHIAESIRTRTQKHSGPRHLQRIWRGEPLKDATVLVRCYHGLGDTIQFIRFATPLRRIARTVIVWAQPELLELVAGVEGVDAALPLHDGAPEVDFDTDIEVMELAHALRVTADSVGQLVPYLSAPKRGNAAPEDGYQVGLVWRAGTWDTRRSVAAAELASLAGIPFVRLCSLAPCAHSDFASSISDRSSTDVAALAATISQLDCVVTVDTMVAHLAGALGSRVFTLLQYEPDWRWGRSNKTRWYPAMTLFRQARPNDWKKPIDQVRASLADLAAQKFLRT